MITLHRHPPSPKIARRYLVLCFFRFLVTGAICVVGVVLSLSDVLHGEDDPRFFACVGGFTSSLLLVMATGAALLSRRLVTPALVSLAFFVWVIWTLITLGNGFSNEDLGGLVTGLIILFAARPPLMLRNYLVGL
ncbi:hypothetical protein [Micromonospora sp. NPDC004704]